MIASINESNKRYNVEQDGSIYFYDFNKSGSPIIIQWLDLLESEQKLITDHLRSQGERALQIGMKAIETRKIKDVFAPALNVVEEGRKVDDTPTRFDVSPMPHDPSKTRW